ncbi:MAG TPA: COQ9 family protein [Rhodospirillales bacterium]
MSDTDAATRAQRDRILVGALPHVAFDGWSRTAMKAGAADASLDAAVALGVFPGGVPDLVDHFADWADRQMLAELDRLGVGAMRVRDRIAAAVKARIEVMAANHEASRRALTFLALPPNAPLAARLLWRTVDAMWYAAGDNATDFNYYSKRGLLAGVYATTVLYWLEDASEDFADTWAFLDRRIADVMKVPAVKSRIKSVFNRLPRPSRLFRRVRRRAS